MAKAKAFYLNYVNGSMLHEQTSKTGNKFVNVSTPFAGSATGLGTIAVFPNQVIPAKNRKTGEIIDNCFNIRLGYETSKKQSYQVSIVTKLGKDGKAARGKNGNVLASAVSTVEATMQELVDARRAEYEAFKAQNPEVAED